MSLKALSQEMKKEAPCVVPRESRDPSGRASLQLPLCSRGFIGTL